MKFVKHLLLVTAFFPICSSALSQKVKVGKATYYANKFHGRRTSSGDVYHKDSFTCAHRTYPFGTILKVRDPKTGNEVYVKVNDRLRGSAAVDLSRAAAKELGILTRGYAHVEITPCNNTTKIPYKAKEIEFPQLQVQDPLGDGYCLLSQWGERNIQKKMEQAMAETSKKKAGVHGVRKERTDSVPRYKILDHLTAQGDNISKVEVGNVIVK